MEATDYIGPLSLVPASIAIVLAFTTRNTVFSLAAACLVGVLVTGQGLMGFPNLLVGALGNEDFSWILLLEF
ncbi:MAG: transporter, partial [Gammaproteobacteria bacterium]|nr:transporter [Gammaproteobacteria bacterium]